MGTTKPHRLLLRSRTLKLGRLRVRIQAALVGTCDSEVCAYGNSWCPNGCKEFVGYEFETSDGLGP